MKTRIYFFILTLLCFTQLKAQYCGNSGPGICTSSSSLTTPGFTPSDSIPCIVRGQAVNTTIEFLFNSQFLFGGQTLTLQSARFDTIDLPQGLCWATNQPTNTFAPATSGCIKIAGTTYAPPGIYKLHLVITADIGFPVTVTAEQAGTTVFLRVVEPGMSCPPIDTTQTTDYQAFDDTLSGFAQVSGTVYYDLDINHFYNTGDIAVKNTLINAGPNYVALTNSSGHYNAYVTPGNYSVTPTLTGVNAQFSYAPSSANVNATTAGTDYANNDFGLTIPSSFCMADLNLVCITKPRPGFTNQANVVFTNTLSAGPATQTIRLYWHPWQQFHWVTPSATVIDTNSHYIEWQVNSVPVGGDWTGYASFYTPDSIALGTLFDYYAEVETGTCPGSDTLAALEQVVVVSSFDPNDKSVSPVGYGPEHLVLPGSPLKYTIRFQNTGTYMAQDVKVIDTLSNELEPLSLQVLSASDVYTVLIEGQTVKFIFKNINLPDSNSNEPLSHGYVQFSVKPKQGTANGTMVSNLADIYFDYNAPVRTNEVFNKFDIGAGIKETADTKGLFVYPNPSNGKWLLQLNDSYIGKPLTVTDLQGRSIYQTIIKQSSVELNLPDLPQGIYLANAAGLVAKLVKQ
ncbi:MAG: T9SS type A sorting domain-containing protein [Chitinophagales bacterium]